MAMYSTKKTVKVNRGTYDGPHSADGSPPRTTRSKAYIARQLNRNKPADELFDDYLALSAPNHKGLWKKKKAEADAKLRLADPMGPLPPHLAPVDFDAATKQVIQETFSAAS